MSSFTPTSASHVHRSSVVGVAFRSDTYTNTEELQASTEPSHVVNDTLCNESAKPSDKVNEMICKSTKPSYKINETLPNSKKLSDKMNEALPNTTKPSETVKETLLYSTKPSDKVQETVYNLTQPSDKVFKTLPNSTKPSDKMNETLGNISIDNERPLSTSTTTTTKTPPASRHKNKDHTDTNIDNKDTKDTNRDSRYKTLDLDRDREGDILTDKVITSDGAKDEYEREVILPSKDRDDADNERNDDDDDGDDEALDGGWGYAVLFGTFIIMVGLGVTSNCFSILFLTFLTQLKTSSSMVAVIYNTESFLWSGANLLGGSLAEVFGFRRVAMTGSGFIFVGMVASAFAPSAAFLIFSHSIVTGLGSGLTCVSSYGILPLYFKRLRGRANAIMVGGICIGGMVGPPLITFIQQQYGFRGATLIVAACLLNNCVGASLFHPVSWHGKKPKRKSDERNRTKSDENIVDKESNSNLYLGVLESEATPGSSSSSIGSTDRQVPKSLKVHSQNEHQSEVSKINQTTDINEIPLAKEKVHEIPLAKSTRPPQAKPSLRVLMKAVFRTTLRNIGVLRSPTALIIAVGGSFITGTFLNFTMMAPFAMEAWGYTQEEASLSLSLSMILNLVGRCLFSPLADLPNFSLLGGFLAGAIIITLSTIVFCFVDGLLWINVVMGVWGFGVGCCMSLYPLLMVGCMGVDKYMATLGVSGVMIGLWLFASGPLFGMIRDVSGSYTVTLCALASSALLSIVFFLFLPSARVYDDARKEREGGWRKEEVGEI